MIGTKQCFLKSYFMICATALALAAPAQADDPTLTVDLSRGRRPISPYIYGVNIPNWCPTYYLDLCAPRLREARVSVVRLGAINMERYNWRTNRMFNVATQLNEYVPLSWESFIPWCRLTIGAEPFLQVPVYGHVAGEADEPADPAYDYRLTEADVAQWIRKAGCRVRFWGLGNEPFIAWKRQDYPLIYNDAAHGDQVLNSDTAYDSYFPRFFSLARTIKAANPRAKLFGPTPANWWLYWTNDYSPLCPVTTPGGPALPDDPAWKTMYAGENIWNTAVFPDRGGDPDVTGWEADMQRILPQFLLRAAQEHDTSGSRVVDYMDVHRYIQPTSDYIAIQEPRGLWQEGFKSYDLETLASGVDTKILKRFQAMVDDYYPETELAFTEYDFFYWQGFPSVPQIAAVAQMDFLGYFARAGVKLACNWYLGEPNQSGEGYHQPLDSSRQALFNEQGEPNPKYWAFWLMSRYFRGEVAAADSDDSELFSVHACTNGANTIVVAAYKGQYDSQGAFIPNQPAKNARIAIKKRSGSPAASLSLKALYRFGMHDPQPVHMQLPAADFDNGTITHAFEPLAIYLFIFSPFGNKQPRNALLLTPERIDFGPYETGIAVQKNQEELTVGVRVTSAKETGISWSALSGASWLTILGPSEGTARVTDTIHLKADRTGLSPGVHDTTLTVATAEGTWHVPVTVEVIAGEDQGVRRLCDFETGSLAHEWHTEPPYSLGWWDGHGGVEDRNAPYVYRFRLDADNKPADGGTASLRVDFTRFMGDTDDGRRYLPFGTYGHDSATADWSDFDAFEFDIRTCSVGRLATDLLIVISDNAGNKGKPDVGIASFSDVLRVRDGRWHTVSIPIGPGSRFYDWRYPEGQNGVLAELDFSHIAQIEFVPDIGRPAAAGRLNIDNLRLIKNGAGAQSRAVRAVP